MRKYVYLFAVGFVIALSACSDSEKGGGNVGYAPNSCFNNQPTRYRYTNNTCVDIQTNQTVPPEFCGNMYGGGAYPGYPVGGGGAYPGYPGNSYDPSCNFGPNAGFYPGAPMYGANPCMQFNTPYEQFYPIFYPTYGGYVCAGFTNLYAYGTPMMYPGATGWAYGCTPGGAKTAQPSGCKCSGAYGSYGGISGGASLGICY